MPRPLGNFPNVFKLLSSQGHLAVYSLCLRSCNLQIDSFFIICLWHVTPLVCQQCEAREHVHFVQQFILWSERRDCAWQALNEVLLALTE